MRSAWNRCEQKKNRKVDPSLREEAALGQVIIDLRSALFSKTLTHEAIKYREQHCDVLQRDGAMI